jgi:hypothetical protein
LACKPVTSFYVGRRIKMGEKEKGKKENKKKPKLTQKEKKKLKQEKKQNK